MRLRQNRKEACKNGNLYVMSHHISSKIQMHHVRVHTPCKTTHTHNIIIFLHNQALPPLTKIHNPIKVMAININKSHWLFLEVKNIQFYRHVSKYQFYFPIPTSDKSICNSQEWSTKDDCDFIFRIHHTLSLQSYKVNRNMNSRTFINTSPRIPLRSLVTRSVNWRTIFVG